MNTINLFLFFVLHLFSLLMPSTLQLSDKITEKQESRMISDHGLSSEMMIKPRGPLHNCWKTDNDCWRMLVLFLKQKRDLNQAITFFPINYPTLKHNSSNFSIMKSFPTNYTTLKRTPVNLKSSFNQPISIKLITENPSNSNIMKPSFLKSALKEHTSSIKFYNIKTLYKKSELIKQTHTSLSVTNSLDVLRKKLQKKLRRTEKHRPRIAIGERTLDQIG